MQTSTTKFSTCSYFNTACALALQYESVLNATGKPMQLVVIKVLNINFTLTVEISNVLNLIKATICWMMQQYSHPLA